MNTALICITTCNRLSEVKKYILPYISFVNSSKNFDFVLALDGTQQEYLAFCSEFSIPLIHSKEREGVGLSKNRVITQFPDYDHYFFIDDDVELLNSSIFESHISLGIKSDEFFHMSSTKLFIIKEKAIKFGTPIIYGNIGGGYFNYFNRKGIEKIGGWHTVFAKYKRYGHTEHSYRFLNAGLSKYPFTIIEDCINKLIIHNPAHVTDPIVGQESVDTELFIEEQKIIDQKLNYFPINTISEYHFNNYDMKFNEKINDFLKENKKKYPMVKGTNRMKCLSSYYLFLGNLKPNMILKIWYFCVGLMYYPLNPEIKHRIKTKLNWK